MFSDTFVSHPNTSIWRDKEHEAKSRLKLQIIFFFLLITFSVALFCLPAKNAYADEEIQDEVTIDGVTYERFIPTSEWLEYFYGITGEQCCVIFGIQSNSHSMIAVPEKLDGYYVIAAGTTADGYLKLELESNVVSLDVSKCSKLHELLIGDGNLSSLKLPSNSNLNYVECDNNKLTFLDVSGCKALSVLACRNNALTSLNSSDLTSIEYLHCEDNDLTSLDISHFTALKWLSCQNNKISNTAALEAWLNQPGHDGQVLPQKATTDSGNQGNTGNTGNSGNAGCIR